MINRMARLTQGKEVKWLNENENFLLFNAIFNSTKCEMEMESKIKQNLYANIREGKLGNENERQKVNEMKQK